MARAEMGPESQFVTLPQGQIHAIVKGEGPDLVMIHGANSNARDFSFDLIDHREGYLEDMVPSYPTLTVPIEVVHGRADRTVGLKYHAERLEAEVDSVNLTRVKGMGHMPHHADPELVAETIRRTAMRASLAADKKDLAAFQDRVAESTIPYEAMAGSSVT